MQQKTPKLLYDIYDAGRLIQEWTAEAKLQDYQRDRKLQAAVERCFEIIGEAIHRLSRYDEDTAAKPGDYPRIIAFRNVLSHGYDVLDHDHVWQVINRELPELLKRTRHLLDQA